MSGSNGKPVKVARPPVTTRNFATQLSPPRPNLPPPSAQLYQGIRPRNDKLPEGREADESENEVEDASTLVNFGDWAAQWDEEEEAWYYYNYISGESTWDKPEELKDLRFENPFGSNDEADSAQIPSPLTAEIPASQIPTAVVPSGTPPVPLPPYSSSYEAYVDDEGNYNYEDSEEYDEEYDDEYDDEYNEVGTKRQTKDKGKGGSSSKGKEKKKDTDNCSGVGFFGLRCIKQKLGIDDILGVKLKSGGSIKKALSKNLSEASLYKNVANDFVQTFFIKVTGWAVLSLMLYGNKILSAKRKKRSTSEATVTTQDYLSKIQNQIERSIVSDFKNLVGKLKQ